jgi:hypothetical protein
VAKASEQPASPAARGHLVPAPQAPAPGAPSPEHGGRPRSRAGRPPMPKQPAPAPTSPTSHTGQEEPWPGPGHKQLGGAYLIMQAAGLGGGLEPAAADPSPPWLAGPALGALGGQGRSCSLADAVGPAAALRRSMTADPPAADCFPAHGECLALPAHNLRVRVPGDAPQRPPEGGRPALPPCAGRGRRACELPGLCAGAAALGLALPSLLCPCSLRQAAPGRTLAECRPWPSRQAAKLPRCRCRPQAGSRRRCRRLQCRHRRPPRPASRALRAAQMAAPARGAGRWTAGLAVRSGWRAPAHGRPAPRSQPWRPCRPR